ncbi:MAG: helix-turn-helix domain-containing protein [Helicobacteraceae bacterium]|jgi:transcriptional regulator with XRE-family HTH domain|nr:helix-turn-helix domain-containing protein [Helicobacteraceae bacterium]
MNEAMSQPKMLSWTIKRTEMSVETVAERVGTKPEIVIEWIRGAKKPTFYHAKKLAKILSVSFGYFYLGGPPRDRLPIRDFRTLSSSKIIIEYKTHTYKWSQIV